ncbi:PTS sugar transporter subunit IIA [Dermacoccus nishinomiyaensis]|uniref:PTS sugar transporter subunit IIA n=1 Tax=Dermacoccus nishinomiyaensis TaxID=1274 RepID=UPI0021A88CB7|nr:PTS glucose transporter subunit IIA [Dermacoccus nishinomiyaensis]MCT1605639.1 PTS glucose transporter subunit IIA [Dermacoccus nishinomiyaensis]
MSRVIAPMAGKVAPLAETPDPVFAAEMVGSGLAIQPEPATATASAPIDGALVKVMPHAFVVAGDDGAILVHLGIDTVKLDGEGFEVHVEEGSHVTAGDRIVTWTPGDVEAQGLSSLVLVCALDTPARLVDASALTASIGEGDVVFSLPLQG